MRIALETLSCDSRTGIGRIVRALAGRFTARGHEVHVFAHDPGLFDECIHVSPVAGFPSSKALSKVLFRVGEQRRLRRVDCDVTYSFGVGRCADVVAAQSCHVAGTEILRSFSLSRWEKPNLGLYDMVSLRDEKVLLTSGKTRKIIACSNLVKNQIIQYYGIEPDRVAVIPNGIVPRPAPSEGESSLALRKRWGVSKKEKLLLFMGNEFGRKGLPTVLEAMARLALPEAHLLVGGGGNIRPFERLTGGLGLSGRVTFLGAVDEPEVLFEAADLFLFPTLYEPFGMVVLEAMAAGLPVITSKSCGAVEGMTHGLHGIFLEDPTSAGELAEWIRRLLANEDLCRSISAAGRKKTGEFGWDAIADRTLEILEHVSVERKSR